MRPSGWFPALVGSTVGTLLMLVVVPAVQMAFDDSVPNSAWIEIGDFRVEDTDAGESPITLLALKVNRSFVADWTATIRAINGDGTQTPICRRGGRSHYIPNARFSDVVRLDWWFGTPPEPSCPLPPGRYAATIAWEITTGGKLLRLVEAESNVFEVR